MRCNRLAALLFGVILIGSLTACSAPVSTDESTWVTAITAGSRSSSSSSQGSASSGEATGPSSSDTAGSSFSATTSAGSTTGSTTAGSAATSASSATSRTSLSSATSSASSAASQTITGYGYCTASTLRVRPEPNTSCEPIGGLARGEKVTILGKSGDWYRIQFGSTEAYVSAQYISKTPPT